MRKNAEDYEVRGIEEAAPSVHVNCEQSSITVGSCQDARTPPPALTAHRHRKFCSHYFGSNIISFLNLVVFTLSLISSFFYVSV